MTLTCLQFWADECVLWADEPAEPNAVFRADLAAFGAQSPELATRYRGARTGRPPEDLCQEHVGLACRSHAQA